MGARQYQTVLFFAGQRLSLKRPRLPEQFVIPVAAWQPIPTVQGLALRDLNYFNFSFNNKKGILSTIDPHYGYKFFSDIPNFCFKPVTAFRVQVLVVQASSVMVVMMVVRVL